MRGYSVVAFYDADIEIPSHNEVHKAGKYVESKCKKKINSPKHKGNNEEKPINGNKVQTKYPEKSYYSQKIVVLELHLDYSL